MNAPIATQFPNVLCSSAKELSYSWKQLFKDLTEVDSYDIKNKAPMIKLAKFGDKKSDSKSLKYDANLIELWGIEGDYDGGVVSIGEASKLREKHDIRAILYSTWSSTDLKPRWRVLVPFSISLPKADHGKFVARLNGALGGILASESFTLSQGYFIGKHPNNPYTCFCTFDDPEAGTCIDLLDELDSIALGKNEARKVVTQNKSVDPFDVNDWLSSMLDGEDINGNALRLVGRMVAKGFDDQTICDTFEGLQDQLIDARGIERVRELFGGELNRMIKGARDKGYAPKSLDTVLSELRRISSDDLRNRWLDLVVPLSVSDRSLALDEVSRILDIKLPPLKQELAKRDKEILQELKDTAVASRVGERVNIIYLPENVATTADLVEEETVKISNDFELAKFAGMLVRVVVEELPLAHYADTELPPAPTAQTDIITRTKLLPLVERAVVFQVQSVRGQISNIGVPEKILDHILVNHKNIPRISAMVTHPVVTAKGRIITAIGIDRDTGLLLYGNENFSSFKAYSKVESIDAIGRINANFLAGFEFSSQLDKSAALALLFTAIERKLMSAAPGGLISAAQQSTGKTTFVKILHVILTGRDLPVMCWPDGNETEVQKMLLSTLLRSPELICFDNVGDGLTFRSPTLALAMTSPVFEGRVLGLSRDASVPTNVMMTVTGNNIKLANDEVHRWLKVSLTTSNSSPHKRQFKNPDVLKYGLSIREEVLRDCIGIIAGYRQQAERIEPSSRFSDWDGLVRQPLMWAGEDDVGRVFDVNMAQSEEMGARIALLLALNIKYPRVEFSVKEIQTDYLVGSDETLNDINEALLALRVKDLRSCLSIGHALGKLVNIPVLVSDADLPLTLTLTSRNVKGLKRYRVEDADDILFS